MNGFRFTIHRPVINSSDIIVAGSDTKNVTYKEENVPINVPTGDGKNVAITTLNETELAVLKLLKKKPRITRDEIAESLSKNIRTIQRTLTSLKNKGYIQRVGPNKNVVWEVVKMSETINNMQYFKLSAIIVSR